MAEAKRKAFENVNAAQHQFSDDDMWSVDEAQHFVIEKPQSGAEVCILRLQLKSHPQASLFVMPRRLLLGIAKEVLKTYEPTTQDDILSALNRIEEALLEGQKPKGYQLGT